MIENMDVKKPIAVVTGATRLKGIGAAICKALAVVGYDIFFTYWLAYDQQMPWKVKTDEPEQLKQLLQDKGARCASLEVDLSDTESLKNVLEDVRARLGYPSVLVNNAAYSTNQNFDALTVDELDRHYAVNVRATTLLSTTFARDFSQGAGGRIINLTSGQSLGAMPGELAYATTKGAVEALTVTLAAEVAGKGITVNAVNPGPTDTGWVTPEFKEELLPQFPMGRLGQPEDVARLIRFLVSEEAAWVTGQVIHSEGGFQR